MKPHDTGHSTRRNAPGVFLTTRWSRVVPAGEADGAEAGRALSELCRTCEILRSGTVIIIVKHGSNLIFATDSGGGFAPGTAL